MARRALEKSARARPPARKNYNHKNKNICTHHADVCVRRFSGGCQAACFSGRRRRSRRRLLYSNSLLAAFCQVGASVRARCSERRAALLLLLRRRAWLAGRPIPLATAGGWRPLCRCPAATVAATDKIGPRRGRRTVLVPLLDNVPGRTGACRC